MNIRKIAATMMMAVSILVVGCSTQGLEPHEEVLAHSVVVSGVAKFVQNGTDPAERASEVVETIDRVVAFSEDGELFTLDELEAEAREQIPWAKLSPEDTLLAEALIGYVRVELERRLEDSTTDIPTDELVEMREVMLWAREAAIVYVERG